MRRNPRSSRGPSDHGRLAEQRSDRRANSDLFVRIQGADAHGVRFDERVRSVNISQHGMALITARDLSHSATLVVNVPHRGNPRVGGGRADFQAQALVAYVLPEGDQNRIGVRFVGATLTP
ncbi:MAG TPA: PilZ domain-containing protein [Terriglobia bacterium]|nr:PilZ domain-containing protein [Terriglobia bacterium]